jgi:hypothetical protein
MPYRNSARVLAALLVAVGALNVPLQAQADCAGASVKDVQHSYAQAQQLDRAGKMREALGAYAAAQEYTCETNPVALPAAQRAAQIALPLGQEAEKQKDFDAAFRLYADGGHYAASDRALMALVRAKPDDPSVFTRARETLEYRGSVAFQNNNKMQLGVTGAYTPDEKNLAEVLRMPATGVQRAFKAEMTAWNEQYLRELADQVQSRPEDLTDMAAVQRYSASQQAFAQKWPRDLLETSRGALSLASAWSSAANDAALAKTVGTLRMQRIEMRVDTLTRAFNRAPSLLDAAIDYQMMQHIDDSAKQAKAQSIRQQAAQLGELAQAQRRFTLATDYFRVARLDDKANAAQEQARQAAMTKMQPGIDQMRQQAEAMQKEFSDPAKVKAMQQQALEMQKAIQAQQQANAKGNAKKADDLEKELGL